MENKIIDKNVLIKKINRSYWWHITPEDPGAYKKRGKFLASTYSLAEIYGKPNLDPEKVEIRNPVFGFSEREILKKLFRTTKLKLFRDIINEKGEFYKKRIALDAKMHNKAKLMGYDSIVLMTKHGKKDLQKGRKPNSIELNIMY